MLYPTEPNMLIKAWDAGAGNGIFQKDEVIRRLAGDPGSVYGVGHAEGRNLRNNLMDIYGSDFSMAYVPDAGVTTSPAPEKPDRRLTVTPEKVTEKVEEGGHRVDAILQQSQSYANAETLAREFTKADPRLGKPIQAALQAAIFDHFTEIARLLADNPALTKDSAEIQQRLAALRGVVGRIPVPPGSQLPEDAARDAQRVAESIITAATAKELKDLWRRLSTQLDEVVKGQGPKGSTQP